MQQRTSKSYLNRRRFAALAGAAISGVSGVAQAPPLIIDTHAHVYSDDEVKYPTIPKPLRPPAGAGSIDTLRRRAVENGVSGVCLVQTSTFYGFDNRLICDTARQTRAWTAGVCTLDPDDPGSPAMIRQLVRDFDIRALRSRPGADGRMDSPGVRELWTACGGLGITINVLCDQNNADDVARLLERFPQQRVVIDHCLNLKAGSESAVLSALEALARRPNAHAKLTFLPTGSGEPYPFRDMHEPCRAIIDAFSPDRCVWGSDFPNELWTPRASYSQNLRLFTRELGLEPAARDAILGSTALRLYFRSQPPRMG
jgi:L-fuconolactonase